MNRLYAAENSPPTAKNVHAVGPGIDHELGQGLLGIEHDEPASGAGRADADGDAVEAVAEGATVLGGCDDHQGFAGDDALGEELGRRVDEDVVRVVELDEMLIRNSLYGDVAHWNI